jgi:hypothetical protein
MTMITNTKVASMAPAWAAFPGFSLLFDNPGDCLISEAGVAYLRCDVASDVALFFYQALADGLCDLGLGGRTDPYSFCPLPPESYHVTVWDGGNQDNFHGFQDGLVRAAAEELARTDGPRSLQGNQVAALIKKADLARQGKVKVRFRYRQLTKLGNSVLVVRLTPADEMSRVALGEIERLRGDLIETFESEFGVRTCGTDYHPHVSLGYFANSECAEMSTPLIESWDRHLHERAVGVVLEFNAIGLYGFGDMSNFFRL